MPATQTFSNQTLGHYQILREAGRGGMSMVYEAEDTRIGRRVALKVLSAPLSLAPEQRAAMIARLKREARAIARLSHPNIVTIFDIGEEDGQHFIVMEFLEGQTLRERIAEGPLPLAETSAILDGVASGLDAVHEAGIIHRDIKPSNVMLLPGGAVKLMDFGVARGHEDTLVTQAGSIVGSPTYMAPEQTQGEESSVATDLWSLGVTLYEMLAGKPPFVGENVPRILFQVAHERPPALPQATPAVRDVLNRALEKKPGRRYESARQLADAFRAALPASAVPPAILTRAQRVPTAPRPARVRSSSTRRPVFWGLGLLLLALLAALPLALRHAPPPARQARVPHTQEIAARPPMGSRPARIRPAAVARPLTPPPAPVVRVATWRQSRTFRHSKHMPRRLAQALPREETVPAAPAHPRALRHLARAVSIRDTAYVPAPRARRRLPRPQVVPRPLPPAPSQKRESVSVAARDSVPVSSSSPSRTESGGEAGPNLMGTWHGTLTKHRATLQFNHRAGNDFTGTMSVHTGGYDAHVAVVGHVSPRTGKISMRETHRMPGTAANAWDLGTEAGQIKSSGRMSGTGTDVKGRAGEWSFSR
jgi:serine/threonine protein kinase